MAARIRKITGNGPVAVTRSAQQTTAPADQDQRADYIEAAEGDAGGDVLPLLLDAAGAAGERLDRFLAARLPQYSRTRLQRWIALGAVYSDDRVLAAKTRLSGGERIVVEPQPLEAERSFRPEPVDLVVVEEDRNLIVLDKPVGLVVHPGAGNWSGTLMNGLLHRWPELAQLPRAGIVHRLDKDTSGLMVVARNEAARGALIEQLATRTMSRRYLALVTGALANSGSVETAIGRDPGNRLRMAVVAEARGRPARTDFQVRARGTLSGRAVALLECRLHTGRTHQIRVHLSSIGHPLLGDELYGGPALATIERQALHAWRLGLIDPATGAVRRWQSPPPDDLRSAILAAGIDLDTALERSDWNAWQ